MPHLFYQRKPDSERWRHLIKVTKYKNQNSSFLLLDQGPFHCSLIPVMKKLSDNPERPCQEARRARGTRSQKWKPPFRLLGPAGEAQQRAIPLGPLSQVCPIDPGSLSHTCASVCWLCPSVRARPQCHTSSLCLTHSFIHPFISCLIITVLGIIDIRVINTDTVLALRAFVLKKAHNWTAYFKKWQRRLSPGCIRALN